MLFPEDTILRYFFGVIIVKHSLDSSLCCSYVQVFNKASFILS